MQESGLTIAIISWIAVVILAAGYWFQIWKIHVHREVRDISLSYNIFIAIGFLILGVTAWYERSTIFLVKQIATTIPVVIIIIQVIYHRKDRWHDPDSPHCSSCEQELESYWDHCPYCGQDRGRKKVRNKKALSNKEGGPRHGRGEI